MDRTMLIDKIGREIKCPTIKRLYIANLEIYTKVAELEVINKEEQGNNIIYINHILPKECSKNNIEETFSYITLSISKMNVFKNINNKLSIRFDGILNYRQRSGYEETIELNNELFTLKTFKDLYNYEEFLNGMEKVIEDANKQIISLLENQGIES